MSVWCVSYAWLSTRTKGTRQQDDADGATRSESRKCRPLISAVFFLLCIAPSLLPRHRSASWYTPSIHTLLTYHSHQRRTQERISQRLQKRREQRPTREERPRRRWTTHRSTPFSQNLIRNGPRPRQERESITWCFSIKPPTTSYSRISPRPSWLLPPPLQKDWRWTEVLREGQSRNSRARVWFEWCLVTIVK